MEELKCPKCGGQHIIKQGFLPSGKRRYVCKDCKKGFSSTYEMKKVVVPCYYCNSENTVKAGITAHKSQIYLCKDCGRRFNKGRVQYEQFDVPCPNCGEKLRFKGWSNDGSVRRFKCAACKKTFSGDKDNLKMREPAKPCPYCGSEDTKRGGTLKSGAKRYKCNDCGKGYNENTVYVEPPKRPEKCPKCNATHINLSGHDTKTGKQRYKCVTCGYKFVENPQYPTPIVWQKECPRCNHVGAKKDGRSNGKQYYKCMECGYKYLEDGMYRHITEKEKEQFRKLYQLNYTIDGICKHMNRTEKTVRTWVSKYITPGDKRKRTIQRNSHIRNLVIQGYSTKLICTVYKMTRDNLYKLLKKELEKETITNQQVSDIIKFGGGCGVPVDYLAPYVKCSEFMCEKILKPYVDNLKKKKHYVRTEQEIAFDNMELDKFMRC